MPYPRAHYYLALFLLMTFVAFWPTYFGSLGQAPIAHHIHGITATLWIFLLIWQSWTIHNRKNKLHRLSGYAAFAIIPPFLAAGLWVTKVTVLKDSPWKDLFGIRLAFFDLAAVIFVALFFYLALKHRRNVQLHARYMLASVFPLLAPTIARLYAFYVPDLIGLKTDMLENFAVGLDLALAFGFLLNLYLLWQDHRNGRNLNPFLTLLVFNLLGLASFYGFGNGATWTRMMADFGLTSTTTLLVTGFALGAIAGATGWRAGKKA